MVAAVLLPELRELLEVAKEFVAGRVNYSFVCAELDGFYGMACILPVAPQIRVMAAEWNAMAMRVWPEMMPLDDPISEEEFRQWVREQLTVFEAQAQEQDTKYV